jgi:hypothetical protein
MDTKLLIDSIVQQTTVLIAQLSTAAGVRAPLSHVADQVFLNLAREIEAQGVGRKVVADMFGLAIRTYQKKVQRLAESQTDGGTTLWHAVLDFIGREGSVERRRLLERFARDPEREVLAVLSDLVSSGFVYATGRGPGTRYGPTSEAERAAMRDADALDSLAQVMWLEVQTHEPIERQTLLERFARYESKADSALSQLLDDGRVYVRDEQLVARNFSVPLGAAQGWEAAVLDHFRTVARAIAAKLSRPRASDDDFIGGSTLHFSVYPGHPREQAVLSLLRQVRQLVLPLWEEVSEYNQTNPPPEGARKVAFYCGQVVEVQDDGTQDASGPLAKDDEDEA